MFNARWILLVILMILIGLAAQQGGLLVLAGLLGTVIPLAWLWNRHSLDRIEYERALSEQRVFAGERVEMTLTVTNRKILPVTWLQIQDTFPRGVTVLGEQVASPTADVYMLVNALSLRWYERVRWVSRLDCPRRGYYFFGPAHLASGDLFGLFTQRRDLADQDCLIVYPQVKPLEAFGLPPKELFGASSVENRIFEDPSRVIGVRDYEPGDEFKRIHWKVTARRQEIQVKVYEPTTTSQILLMLNIATLPKYWQGIIRERLERVISLAASLASEGVTQRYQVGVLANGSWPLSEQPLRVLPSRDPAQLMHILEALAAISDMPTMPFETLLSKASPDLPWSATLVVITSVVTDEILAAMRNLWQAGRRQVLISLDPETPEHLEGIRVYHLPAVRLEEERVAT